MTSDAGGAGPPNLGFLPSIALIRAIAALLVVYDHLVGIWLERNSVSWLPAQLADRWIFEPLHVMMHGGGFAVAMFFLVSGFVIVYVAQRENRGEFAIRRALRIYPPLWISIALLLIAFGWGPGRDLDPGAQPYAVQQVLADPDRLRHILVAATLGNYLIGTPSVNGVAWTLIIEVLFYAAVAVLLPLLKSRPRTALCIAFVALALLQALARTVPGLFLLAVNGVYVAYLFLGSLVYFRFVGRIGNGFFIAGSVAYWGLFLRGIDVIVLQPPYRLSDYGVSYAFAWFAFVLLLLLDERIRLGTVSAFFSRISYSLYLNHGGLGLLALTVLYPRLGYPLSLAVTFILVVAISAASYRWVEQPSQRLARKWTRRTE